MSLALAFLAGAAIAGSIATALTWRRLTLRYDLDGYNQRRIEATSLRGIADAAAEHVHEAVTEARGHVGDLLDTVIDLTEKVAELSSPPAEAYSPVPEYGVSAR